MELFIAWIVFSLVAGVIASSKGLSAAKFIFVSLLLSPLVGILVALGSRPNLEALERRRVGAGELKTCPFCAESIKAEAIVCRYCGRELVAAPVVAATTVDAEKQATGTKKPLTNTLTVSEPTSGPFLDHAAKNSDEPKVFGVLSTRAYNLIIGASVVALVALIALLAWSYVEKERHAAAVIPVAAPQMSRLLASGSAFYRPMNRAVSVARVITDFGRPDIDDSSADDRPRPPMPARVLFYRQADVKVLFLADAPLNAPPPYKGWIFLGFTNGSSKQALDSTEALRRLDMATRH